MKSQQDLLRNLMEVRASQMKKTPSFFGLSTQKNRVASAEMGKGYR